MEVIQEESLAKHDTANELFEWTSSGARPLSELLLSLEKKKHEGARVVTTNGCFDLLHVGHLQFLEEARRSGDILVVALNSDSSVHQIKGQGRPILPIPERAAMLLALRSVDHVVVFDELLPINILDRIKPAVHCKAGDYTIEALPEAPVVQKNGGRVLILPLTKGYSTSQFVERVRTSAESAHVPPLSASEHDRRTQVVEFLLESSNVLRQTAYQLSEPIITATDMLHKTLADGHKILLCGNGGSAADCQHIAAELVGRFKQERAALAAIALTTDTSILTAVGNDFGFEEIFARQVAALGAAADVLIALSTSGKSKNILNAINVAHSKQMYTIGLTGSPRSPIHDRVDLCLHVPATETALVQQAHLAILHIICDLVEQSLVAHKMAILPAPAGLAA